MRRKWFLMKPILSAFSNKEFQERSKPKAAPSSTSTRVAPISARTFGIQSSLAEPLEARSASKQKKHGGTLLFLDNIEQLGTRRKPNAPGNDGNTGEGGEVEPFEVLRKRARAKYYGSSVAGGLYMLDSPLKKSYGTTFYQCAETLEQNGTKVTSRYCGHRWCVVCNRIRTANLIKGYEVPLSRLEDLQFVTLTVPNVEGNHLRETIERMIKQVQSVQNMFQKRQQRGLQGWQLVGLRKLECTYNAQTGEFHPHFHFVISGKEAAKGLRAEWLRRVETATYKAQDVRKAGKGSENELFKYFAKMVTKVDGKRVTLLEPLDIIFQAMRGLRVFQPMGGLKKVSEEIEELKAVEVAGIEAVEETAYWKWESSDWVNPETGEARTGYIPSAQAEELNSNIFKNLEELKAGKPKPLEGGNAKPKQAVEPTLLAIDLEAHRKRVFSEMDALERERAASKAAQELPFVVPMPTWEGLEVPTFEGLEVLTFEGLNGENTGKIRRKHEAR